MIRMNKLLLISLLIMSNWSTNQICAQVSIGNEIYEEGLFTFPNGKTKALILSYDDGLSQDTLLVAILNKFKLKGSFNLNSGLLGTEASWLKGLVGKTGVYLNENQIKTTYENHEIAAHSVSHPHLVVLPDEEIDNEISNDIKNLEKISNTLVRSFAYPFGEYNENLLSILRKSGVTNARTVNDTQSFELPEDFLIWHPTCHHSIASESINQFVQTKSEKPSLFYMWGHSWEFDKNSENNNWQYFEDLCEKLSGNSNIWYVGAGEFVEYIDAIKGITGQDELINNSNVSVWIKKDGDLTLIKAHNK